MKKRLACLLLAGLPLFACAPSASSSSTPESTPVAPTKALTVTSDVTYIGVNEYAQLSVANEKGEAVNASFSSSDKSIATVSSSGVVKGVAYGTVTINVTADGYPSASIEITVGESKSLFSVTQKILSASSFKVDYTGSLSFMGTNYELEMKEYVTPYVYYYDANGCPAFDSVGYGTYGYDAFEFQLVDGRVSDATYFRYNYSSYNDLTLTLKGLTGNYFSLQPNEEGLYDLLGSDDSVLLMNLLFQHTNLPSITANFSLDSLTVFDAEVPDPNTLIFHMEIESLSGKVNPIDVTVSDINSVSLPWLDEFLAKPDIKTPEVYEDVEKAYELVSKGNYVNDLGAIGIYEDNTGDLLEQIEQGSAKFTSDYVYFDYTDEFLDYYNKEMEEYGEKLSRGGYINLSDGVYTFFVDENESIALGDKWEYVDGAGQLYTRYQDYYPNPWLILDIIKEAGRLYTFTPLSGGSGMMSDNAIEYISDADVSLEIASALDEDAQGAGGTAYALSLGMELNEFDPSQSIIAIGGMFEFADYFGMVLPPIYTEYTGFGHGNVAILDQYLAANA